MLMGTTPKLLVLDDEEGELAGAPAMEKLRRLAEVDVLSRPLLAADLQSLKEYNIMLALRERTTIDSALLDALPNLELILQTGGHAYHIDCDAATDRGVVVALGRRVTTPPIVVPELVFGFLLGLVRDIYSLNKAMQAGEWQQQIGGSLAGKTIGILGYGRHGRPVARLAEAFGMRVLAWARTDDAGNSDDDDVVRLPLAELLAYSDFVSVHLRLSDESRGLINAKRLAQMKPGAFLINTARGAIVDEEALVDALTRGHLAGAGLDVFVQEPLPTSSRLRLLPNVLLTPHVGWQVRTVLHEFVSIAAEQLNDWLNKRLESTEVLNPGALTVGRKRCGAIV